MVQEADDECKEVFRSQPTFEDLVSFQSELTYPCDQAEILSFARDDDFSPLRFRGVSVMRV